MAVRLPLLLIQSQPPGPAGTQLVEQVIGELIGRPGVDLILLADLERIDDFSTDRLTLESINSHVAVLGWSSPAETLGRLADLDFHGCRWPHANDAAISTPAEAGRKIFFFDLNLFDSAAELCDAIRALLASQQVKTFSLGGSVNAAPASTSRPVPHPQNGVTGSAGDATKSADNAVPRLSPSPRVAAQSKEPLDLERLADELDATDL